MNGGPDSLSGLLQGEREPKPEEKDNEEEKIDIRLQEEQIEQESVRPGRERPREPFLVL
jgi:hypothetical protein